MHLPRSYILGICLDAYRYVNLYLDLIIKDNSASGNKRKAIFFSVLQFNKVHEV